MQSPDCWCLCVHFNTSSRFSSATATLIVAYKGTSLFSIKNNQFVVLVGKSFVALVKDWPSWCCSVIVHYFYYTFFLNVIFSAMNFLNYTTNFKPGIICFLYSVKQWIQNEERLINSIYTFPPFLSPVPNVLAYTNLHALLGAARF